MSLGIPKGYTIVKLIIPSAFKYIMTSLGLGTVFAMGATAPIMYTGVVIVSGVPGKLTDPSCLALSFVYIGK